MSENANTCSPLAPCDHENRRPGPAKPRLLHGGIEHLSEEHDRRVALHWAVANPWTEQAVMPPFTAGDLDYTPFLPEQGQRDQARRLAVVSQIAGQHEDRHWFWAHPFCYVCSGDEVMAHRRLETYMAIHPGKEIPMGLDALPEPEVEQVEAADEFLTVGRVHELGKTTTAWLVDQIIPAGKHGIIRGRDASFKSFLALDFCLHIATAMDWQGRATSQGRVMYLAGEGVTSFGDRIDSWTETHGDLDEDEQADILIRNGTVDLHGAGPAFDRLLAKVAEWKPRILVADTLQRSAGAGDQNSASDMAVLRERMAQLQQAAGGDCTTVFVAHTTKGDGDTRGSSSIEDDSDFVLHCTRSEMKLTMGVKKEKDAPDDYDIELAARVVGKSLAIVGPKEAGPILWDSSAPKNRVIGVLRYVGGVDGKSVDQITAMLKEDGTGRDVPSRAAIYEYLKELETEGLVRKEKPGAAAAKFYIIETPDTKEN